MSPAGFGTIAATYGIFGGTPAHTAVLRLRPAAARDLLERDLAHYA